MDLRDYLRLLARNWLLILLLTLAGVAVTTAYTLVQVPQYQSTSKLYISVGDQAQNAADLSAGSLYAQTIVKSYADVVTTPLVLNPVIKSLHLDTTAGELAERMTASAPLNTAVLSISATDKNPATAARIVDSASATLSRTVLDLTPVKVVLLQSGTVSRVPVSPDVELDLAIGLLIGLAAGLLAALARQSLDTKVRRGSDIATLTDLPIIGSIPFDSSLRNGVRARHVPGSSPSAEAFRSLRTNLQYLAVGQTPKCIMISSAIGSEGKTTIATNLASALSEAGFRTLLIDADLRRSKVVDYLGLDTSIGLSDVLAGVADLPDALQTMVHPTTLTVLPAGAVPPNPSEMLQSSAMKSLMNNLADQYDRIVIDAPPLLPVSDAAILSHLANGTILVAAIGRVTRSQFSGAVGALTRVNARVLGVVESLVPQKRRQAYGYGYGYQSKVEESKTGEPAVRPTDFPELRPGTA